MSLLSAMLLPVGLTLWSPLLRSAPAPRPLCVQMQQGPSAEDQQMIDKLKGEQEALERRLMDELGLADKYGYVAKTAPATPPPADVGATASPVDNEEPDSSTRAVRVLGPIALVAGSAAATLAVTSATAPAPITMAEVVEAQKAWGDALVGLSKTCLDGGDCVGAAQKAADELYGYGRTDVLFKPTKASEAPFRGTGAGALSYFIGGDKIYGGFKEDKGFALNYGKGFKKVIFDNDKVDLNGATAQAMGEYYFVSADGSGTSKVEYTFGYKRNEDGKIRIYLHHSSLPYAAKPPVVAPITVEEIQDAQKAWGNAIVRISKVGLDGGDVVKAAAEAADELYGYGRTDVLFKPTKASVDPFRPTAEGALSYFVGDQNVNNGFKEDHGFALGPDEKGWKKVIFDNSKVVYNGATAQAIGEYYFYSAADDSVAKVEYTFGYKRNEDGKVRIYLHHSSLPYSPKPPPVAPITVEEIVNAQKAWGNAIVRISKVGLVGGDVVKAAAEAADELYGYGRTDVLFKPTKASEDPFRPTAEGALSYFVGDQNVNNGFKEDHGFALGPDEKGWKKVIFDNSKVSYNGATAQAMGEYYFYSAADDSVAKVEYTFGYKRNEDGKIRIYLHHSSLPYKPKPAA